MTVAAILFVAALALSFTGRLGAQPVTALARPGSFDEVIQNTSGELFSRGQQIFRFDTFGDERFWSDTLRLHQAVAGASNGGVGSGLSPAAALAAGLKVDVDMVPQAILSGIQAGTVNLNDPANTLALISASLLQTDQQTVRNVLMSWGPGKFDATLFLDGKAFRPDGSTAATLIPPAYGLAGVNLHTYTGWGSVPYWNAFVGNLELHGSGVFYDPRLNDATKFPVAARAGLGNVRPASASDDGITSRLPALQYYQLSIPAPAAPVGSFIQRSAESGQALFNGRARCSGCHVPPIFTEPGWGMHTAEEIGIDDFQARRSPDNRYRTTPLKGAWSRAKGGYYHDGRFATLRAVVEHYDRVFSLRLTATEMNDLVEYLKSI